MAQLAGNELSRAATRMVGGPEDQAIHDARKALKRVWALLRLLQPDLGRHYLRLNGQLREVAHSLSGLRDAKAMLDTLAFLAGEYRLIPQTARRSIARGLTVQRRVAGRQARNTLRSAEEVLQGIRAETERRVREASSWRAIRQGVKRGYRRAREAGAALEITSSTAEFHRWRRRIKDHWYQCHLLERVLAQPRQRLARLAQLEEILGLDHNLAVLADHLLAQPEHFGRAREVTLVLGCIARKRRVLRQEALRLGRRLFVESAAEFSGRLPKRMKDAR